jgi:hypothetical protein
LAVAREIGYVIFGMFDHKLPKEKHNNRCWSTWYHYLCDALLHNPCRHAVRREFPCILGFIVGGAESRPQLKIGFAPSCRSRCESFDTLEVLQLNGQPFLPLGSKASLHSYLDSLDLQFQRSVVISYDDRSRVLL